MPEVKERPILMSAPMVIAALAGTKTQTRRIMNPQPNWGDEVNGVNYVGPMAFPVVNPVGHQCGHAIFMDGRKPGATLCRNRYGIPGDRIWVRETVAIRDDVDPKEDLAKALHYIHYRADYKGDLRDEWHDYGRWKPSIFMPRWASRISLEITDVRVERLQDISEDDAIAEGIEAHEIQVAPGNFTYRNYSNDEWCVSPILSYKTLWEKINGAGSWDINPFVWAISFRKI